MRIERIDVDVVEVGERLRPLDPAVVDALAESMSKIGLLTPISVYQPDDGATYLIAGYHRLEAARKLGWSYIDGVFADTDEITRRQIEISENLHRSELTVQERADHIAAWIELNDIGKPGQLVQVFGGRGNKGGISDAVRHLPIAGTTDDAKRKNAQRAVKIASITPEAKQAARTAGIDNNQSKLLAVAKAAPQEQVAAVERLAKQKPRDPAPAKADPAESEFSELMSAWVRARGVVQNRFLAAIGCTVAMRGAA